MHVVLAVVFAFAILTLWVPAYWPVAVFEAGVYLLAGAVLFRARHSLPRFTFPLLPFTAAVLWSLFQWLSGRTIYAFDTTLAILRWTAFCSVLATCLILFRDPPVRRWFRSAMLWFGFMLAVVATFQTFTSEGRIFWLFPTAYTDHVMGPILNRNHYAAFIEIVFPFALYYAFRAESGRLLYSGMAAAMYASVIASASRAGTVLLTAEILAVALAMRFQKRISARAAGAAFLQIILLFGAFTAVVGWENVWERFRDPDPLAVRRELAVSTVQIAATHPWFGTGLGTWPVAYPRYAIIDTGNFANQAHSDWLQWAAEGGIPFGLLMAALLVWCIRPAFQSVWGIGIIAVLMHAAIDYPFSRPALGSWAVLIIGMLGASSAKPQIPGRQQGSTKL